MISFIAQRIAKAIVVLLALVVLNFFLIRMAPGDPALVERLRAWRREVSAAAGVPAYVVFHDRTLAEIAGRRPRSLAELGQVPGVGPAKLERYGAQLLGLLERSN